MEEKPIFVKLDEYSDISDIINLVRKKLDEAKSLLEQINKLREQEDAELDDWRREMGNVEEKIEQIDTVLFKPEGV
ncbi:hypothetical protein KY339_05655 [Candidatus Woesearchaeota archaeon]|jgi:hypothetical protein|nr:hypothetical protein [Candidatus Woesearchaeota archaeon]